MTGLIPLEDVGATRHQLNFSPTLAPKSRFSAWVCRAESLNSLFAHTNRNTFGKMGNLPINR
jgi:hypothetical protein